MLDSEEDINWIHIQMAQDLHDIIWENYYQLHKKTRYVFIGSFYVLLCAFFWVGSGFCEYIITKNFLTINFIDPTQGFSLDLFDIEFKSSGTILGFSLLKFFCQMVGFYVLESLLDQARFSYYSSCSNFTFIFTSIYELFYMFPATHYGYTKAVFNMREQFDA